MYNRYNTYIYNRLVDLWIRTIEQEEEEKKLKENI